MPRPSFLAQDVLWALERLKRKLEKHLLLPRMSIPSLMPDLYDEISVERNVAIPMRDGIRLFADLYRPKAGAKLPVIVTRLPYGKGESYCFLPAIGRFYARKGYVYVAQDVRGKWRSEGVRVEISSSNLNCFDRNPNTGEPFGTAVRPVSADQQVFHTAEYPSQITLPINPR